MDLLFHAGAGACLAAQLGERRRGWLAAAAAVAVLPDVLHGGLVLALPVRDAYSWGHTLLVQLPVAALLLTLNWRIAFGALLHLAVDVFTHGSATKHLLYPLAQWYQPVGIAWWHGWGLLLWAGLWLALLLWLRHHWQRLWAPSAVTAIAGKA